VRKKKKIKAFGGGLGKRAGDDIIEMEEMVASSDQEAYNESFVQEL
jgi:hypothetical protein